MSNSIHRLSRIHLFRPLSSASPTSRPLFIFLPGMDGSGKLLARQLEGLETQFDVCCLSLPVNDLSSWPTLAMRAARLIAEERDRTGQPVYICAESFGGCLALLVALRQPELLHRLILINPASSFSRLPWLQWGSMLAELLPSPVLPSSLYRLSAWGLEPFLINSERVTPEDRTLLLQTMQSVHPRTAAWRLRLLRSFDLQQEQLERLDLPVLLVAGERDRLLPSIDEVQRIAQRLPQHQTFFLPHSGHACLLEKEVHLGEILQRCGFWPQQAQIQA